VNGPLPKFVLVHDPHCGRWPNSLDSLEFYPQDRARFGNATDVFTDRMTAADSSLIYELPSILERLDLSKIFRTTQPLEVELGSGDGSFLVDLAKSGLQHNFVGIERLLGRIRKMERKARRAELTNLRGIRIESSYFLEYLLPPYSVEALHIYFPDPWPKRKHRRHRLINERFPQLAHRVLRPGGLVYLRTDDGNYFNQMNTVFAASPIFQPTDTPVELAALLTDFEKDFHARGISTLRAAYQVRVAPS
jgi:tRNA (guanine-N7-)-methyltransferase